MKEIPKLTFAELSEKYCARQEQTPEVLKGILLSQKVSFAPIGWMLLECEMLDSSYLGSLTILPYGPHNTFKTIPDHPISPRGLASDMSCVIGIMLTEELQ